MRAGERLKPPICLASRLRPPLRKPAGRKIRIRENIRNVVVRWAFTDRPAAAEEELHRLHIAEFGHLPKYTLRT